MHTITRNNNQAKLRNISKEILLKVCVVDGWAIEYIALFIIIIIIIGRICCIFALYILQSLRWCWRGVFKPNDIQKHRPNRLRQCRNCRINCNCADDRRCVVDSLIAVMQANNKKKPHRNARASDAHIIHIVYIHGIGDEDK